MTVDGGTKCWHEFVTAEGHASEVIDSPSPHVICGDLDSLPMEMLECYPQARVTRTPDQDETDFTKSLRVLDEYLVEKRLEVDAAVAVCDWSGRPDQVLGNVSTLLRAAGEPGAAPVFLLAESSLTWLLPAGSHVLEVPARLREGRCWCSLAPVGRPARCVSTSGLRWDLDHRELEFGKLVSTSNKFSGEPRVTVRTDSPLVWSMGLGYISD
ncbi:thiamin pyrophosphokinase 1 isoform X2 [Bacillus rossius redtenbacheri]